MIVDKEIPIDAVLNNNELDMVADAIAEYITDETGYCVNSFSVSFNITADLNISGE